jgi:hypothetical protein
MDPTMMGPMGPMPPMMGPPVPPPMMDPVLPEPTEPPNPLDDPMIAAALIGKMLEQVEQRRGPEYPRWYRKPPKPDPEWIVAEAKRHEAAAAPDLDAWRDTLEWLRLEKCGVYASDVQAIRAKRMETYKDTALWDEHSTTASSPKRPRTPPTPRRSRTTSMRSGVTRSVPTSPAGSRR